MKTKPNLADFLWPIAGTVLGLIVIPVAIAQYPKFFNENEWLLPASVVVVVICWLVPLLFHNRARRIYAAIFAVGTVGKILLPSVSLAIVIGLFFGGKELLTYHRNHLKALNQPTKSSPAETPSRSVPTANAPIAQSSKPEPERRQELALVPLMFKDSPLFTAERRNRINTDINGFAAYLKRLGIPIPTDIPPIGVDTTNPKATGWSFNEQGNNKYYYNQFTLQQGILDNRRKVTEAFCSFVIGRFIYKPPPPIVPHPENQAPQQIYDAIPTPEQMDQSYRWMATGALIQYLNHSYWNQPLANGEKPICPDQGNGLTYYFWRVREKYGKEFTDKLAAFTIRATVDKPYIDATQNFRQYFYERLKMADSVIDNENSKMPTINAILRECAWLPK